MRNPNGYGSVYKLSGKRRNPWAARVTVGMKPSADGKKMYPEYQFIGFYRTKRDAQDALAEWNAVPLNRVYKKRITLEEVYSRWSEKGFENVGDSTLRRYHSAWKALAPLYETDINAINLQTIENVLRECPKGYTTLVSAKTLLRRLFECAAKYDWMPASRVALIDYLELDPPPEREPIHQRLDPEFVANVQKEHDDLSECVTFLIYTGLRIGEYVELKSEDVNLEKRYIDIKKAKTPAGVRLVPIHDKLLPYVKKCLDANRERFMPFETSRGRPLSNDGLRTRLTTKFGSEFRAHNTRYTFISLLQEEGCPAPILHSIVGHRGESVTESVYTQISLEAKLKWVNKLA